MAKATTSASRTTSFARSGQNKKTQGEIIKVSYEHRPFRRINLYMMAGCVLLIIIGFLLMLGPGSSVEGGFNPDIFSARRIAVGPALTFLGFLLMAFAIIWSPRRSRTDKNDASAAADRND